MWGSLRCDHSLINDRGITATVVWQHTTFFFSKAVTPLDLRFIGQLIILHLFTQMNLKREGGNHFGVLCELRITFQYIIWRLKEWVQKCILTVRICICVTKDTPSGLGTSKCILWYIIYSPSGLTLLGIEFSDYWSSLNSIAFVIKPSVLYYVFPLYNQPLYCEYSMLALLLRGIKSFLYTTKIMRYNLIGFGRVSFLRSDIPHFTLSSLVPDHTKQDHFPSCCFF